jgi:hypothetical protein
MRQYRWPMPTVHDEDREHITSGPRWDRVGRAIEDSIRLLNKKAQGHGRWVKALLHAVHEAGAAVDRFDGDMWHRHEWNLPEYR